MKVNTLKNGIRRHGVVLIVVLVLVMMVALAGFGFLSSMTIEYEAAKINGQLIQAQQTLASAQAMITWVTELPEKQRQAMGGIANQPELFRGRIVRAVSSSEDISEQASTNGVLNNPWQFSVIHPFSKSTRGNLQFGMKNESVKLHLAMILRWEESEAGTGREALLQLPGMTESLADSLLDWLDRDDDPREFGAESDYYQRLDKPYLPRNGIPETLDELLFVKGVTRGLLYGSSMGSSEELGLDSDGIRDWTQIFTCTSAERNLNPESRPKIDLNLSDLSQLQDSLAEYFDESMVRYIILGRQYGISFADSEDSSQASSTAVGTQPEDVPFSVRNPSQFTIASPVSLIDSYVEVPTGESKSNVVSPLQSTLPEFPEIVELIFSRTTTNPAKSLIGRINVQQASETVLKTLPEMTEEIASQIVQERESLSESEKLSTAWLVSRQVIDITRYRQWAPYITNGGDVFTGEIVVFRTSGGPFLRRKLTIDASKPLAAPVDWIDLTDQGLPVPLRLLSRSDNNEIELLNNPMSN